MNGFSTLSGGQATIMFPPSLNCGDTWAFDMPAGEYSSSDWSASMTFASGTFRLVNMATLSQGVFYFVVPPADTKTVPPGNVVVNVSVNNATTGEVYTLQQAKIAVLPDINDPSVSVPTQTMLQQQLAACDATLLQLLSQRTSSVVFAGKAYTLIDIAKLWAVRNEIAQWVTEELLTTSGNSRSRLIIPVFKNPWGGPYPSHPWYPYGW